MHARKLMLTILGGGTALGLLFGATINTTMKPPPDPPWRHTFQPPAPSTDAYQLVDAGPQDLSPTWYRDRMPTWKRDRYDRAPDFTPLRYDEYTDYTDLSATPPEPAPDAAPEDIGQIDPAAEQRDLAAFDHATAAEDAAEDARDAMATAALPGVAEQDPASASHESPAAL